MLCGIEVTEKVQDLEYLGSSKQSDKTFSKTAFDSILLEKPQLFRSISIAREYIEGREKSKDLVQVMECCRRNSRDIRDVLTRCPEGPKAAGHVPHRLCF